MFAVFDAETRTVGIIAGVYFVIITLVTVISLRKERGKDDFNR